MSVVKTDLSDQETRLRDDIKAELQAGLLMPREIATKLSTTYQLVNSVKRSIDRVRSTHGLSLRDPLVSGPLETTLIHKLQHVLKSVHPYKDSSTDTKNKVQAFALLYDRARLAADKSTSNIQSKSLAVAVVRRAGKKEDVA